MSASYYKMLNGVIDKKSLVKIDFTDVRPNMFSITNGGKGDLYVGIETLPGDTKYQYIIPKGNNKIIGRPVGQFSIYFYNPSSTESLPYTLEVTLENYNIGATKDTNVNVTVPESIKFDGVIKGFNIPLPEGNNHLGKVPLNELPAGDKHLGNVSIENPLPTGENNIGKVTPVGGDLDTLAEKVEQVITGLSKQANILQEITSIKSAIRELQMGSQIIPDFLRSYDQTSGDIIEMNFIKVPMISNDGSVDITVNIGGGSITLKPGEVLTDLELKGSGISVSGDSSKQFRIVLLGVSE